MNDSDDKDLDKDANVAIAKIKKDFIDDFGKMSFIQPMTMPKFSFRSSIYMNGQSKHYNLDKLFLYNSQSHSNMQGLVIILLIGYPLTFIVLLIVHMNIGTDLVNGFPILSEYILNSWIFWQFAIFRLGWKIKRHIQKTPWIEESELEEETR